nr:unnamed protein product [Haemonchus contortus]
MAMSLSVVEGKETDHIRSVPGGGDGIVNLIGNRVGDIIDLLVIGSEGNSYDYAEMVLTESNKVVVCQFVNSEIALYCELGVLDMHGSDSSRSQSNGGGRQ